MISLYLQGKKSCTILAIFEGSLFHFAKWNPLLLISVLEKDFHDHRKHGKNRRSCTYLFFAVDNSIVRHGNVPDNFMHFSLFSAVSLFSVYCFRFGLHLCVSLFYRRKNICTLKKICKIYLII